MHIIPLSIIGAIAGFVAYQIVLHKTRRVLLAIAVDLAVMLLIFTSQSAILSATAVRVAVRSSAIMPLDGKDYITAGEVRYDTTYIAFDKKKQVYELSDHDRKLQIPASIVTIEPMKLTKKDRESQLPVLEEFADRHPSWVYWLIGRKIEQQTFIIKITDEQQIKGMDLSPLDFAKTLVATLPQGSFLFYLINAKSIDF